MSFSGPHLSSSLAEAVVETGPDAVIIRGTGLGHIPIQDPLGVLGEYKYQTSQPQLGREFLWL